MAGKIVFEIWDAKAEKCESATAFDTVAVFLGHAAKFKAREDGAHLRVHIPGGFALSADDTRKIDALGIKRI